MGLPNESIKYLRQQLQCHPVSLQWEKPKTILVRRGASGKLGFHFKTFQCGPNETATVVVLVKEDCITEGSLQLCDRIVSVDGVSVTSYSEENVRRLLSQTSASKVSLLVSAMSKANPHTQVKRFLSINSGTSRNSSSASLSSTERPVVKRFAKSNSTETEKSAEAGENTPLLPLGGHSQNSGDHQSGCRAEATCVSKGLPSGKQTQLLSKKMSNEIKIHDIVCVVQESDSPPRTQTLPSSTTSSNPHPTSSSTTSSESFFVERGKRGDRSAESLGVEVCSLPSCNIQTCLWHKFVLGFPQYVIWDPFTKTFELNKNGSTSFGFKFKVKKHDGPPGEVFALVTEILPGGAAWKQLLPGDWIRSVNGTAVNSAEEAFGHDFRSCSSLRLVIQRPAGLLQQGAARLKQQADAMENALHFPSSSSSSRLMSPTSPKVSQGSLSTMSASNWMQNSDEHIPLNTLGSPNLCRSSSAVDRCTLTKVRVIVCGNRAGDLVRGLMENCGSMVNGGANVQCFQLSMQLAKDKKVKIHTWPEPSVAIMQEHSSVPSQYSGSRAGQDWGSAPDSLNLELCIISDENFFHHCAASLFTTNTLLLLTFDVVKMQNQSEREMARLAALIHTAHACSTFSGCSASMHLYGMLSGAQPVVSAEEVQALFYVTQAGSQLLERFELSPPDIASPCCAAHMASVRYHLFQWCRILSEQCMVVSQVPALLDALLSFPNLQVTLGDLKDMLDGTAPEVGHQRLPDIIKDLTATGNLIPYRRCQEVGESQEEYLLPFNIMLALGQLFTKNNFDGLTPSCRQKWFKLLSDARISPSDLSDILEVGTTGSRLTPQILVHLGVIFPFRPVARVTPRDSGFGEDAVEYVVPYFLVDQQMQPLEKNFVVQLQAPVPWRVYFDGLSKLSMHPSVLELNLCGLFTCFVTTSSLQLCLQFQKSVNRLQISASKGDGKSKRSITLQEIKQLLDIFIPPHVHFTVQHVDTQTSSSDSVITSVMSDVQKLPFVAGNEDTHCKQRLFEAEPTDPPINPQTENKFDVPLRSLNWSTLKSVALCLNKEMTTCCNWKDVAEHAGKTVDEICGYEGVSASELPAMIFLKEWSASATVQQLLDILEAIERPDAQDIILNSFRNK